MEANMRALDHYDETDSRAESSIRLADLEALVCDLLRRNQILREELASLRPRAIPEVAEQATSPQWKN
jgi:hypothetical protein